LSSPSATLTLSADGLTLRVETALGETVLLAVPDLLLPSPRRRELVRLGPWHGLKAPGCPVAVARDPGSNIAIAAVVADKRTLRQGASAIVAVPIFRSSSCGSSSFLPNVHLPQQCARAVLWRSGKVAAAAMACCDEKLVFLAARCPNPAGNGGKLRLVTWAGTGAEWSPTAVTLAAVPDPTCICHLFDAVFAVGCASGRVCVVDASVPCLLAVIGGISGAVDSLEYAEVNSQPTLLATSPSITALLTFPD
jgi:hypothetical protein